MRSHALCQGCKNEYDKVLTPEVPTVKLNRQQITFPFLYDKAISIQM